MPFCSIKQEREAISYPFIFFILGQSHIDAHWVSTESEEQSFEGSLKREHCPFIEALQLFLYLFIFLGVETVSESFLIISNFLNQPSPVFRCVIRVHCIMMVAHTSSHM